MSRAFVSRHQRGSFGSDFGTTPVTSEPFSTRASSVVTGLRGRDDAAHVTQDMGSYRANGATLTGATPKSKAMVDSYLSSFNSLGITSPRIIQEEVQDIEGEDMEDPFDDNSNHVTNNLSSTLTHSKGPAPIHPGTITAKNRPPLQKLEELPGLSIVTWEEFVECPSVLCGLFELDKNEYIHYNPEQVNVFFHDARMEQPTLGAPSGDGLSWTIFVDNYSHLRSVRTWLTERVSVLLLQLLRSKGQGSAACLVAINPLNKSVGEEISSSFSRATEAFLHQRNFSVELNLNSCVKKWCSTVLKMPCDVGGGRLVVTNGDQSVPCCPVENVPYCVLCFPIWGISKLSYKLKRRSDYEDFFLYFTAEDLALCTKSPKLKQFTEKTNNNSERLMKPVADKSQPWIRKNKQAVTIATQTLETGDDDGRANLEVEEVDDVQDSRDQVRLTRPNIKDMGRGKDSGFSSATSTDDLEPRQGKGLPSYKPRNVPKSRVKPQVSDDRKAILMDQSLSDSMNSSVNSSTALFPGHGSLSSKDPTPRAGAHNMPMTSASLPMTSLSYTITEDEGEGENEDDVLRLMSDFNSPRTPREDPRAAGFPPLSTVPIVGSDYSDNEGGNYQLLSDTESPRPDTPWHPSSRPKSQKTLRTRLLSQDAVIDETVQETIEEDVERRRMQLRGGVADLPQEPTPKQRKKKINHMKKDVEGDSSLLVESRVSVGKGFRTEAFAHENPAFSEEEGTDIPFKNLKNIDKVKYTPIKGLKERKNTGQKAFPYTSELMDFVGENPKNKTSYSLVDEAMQRGNEMKANKKEKSETQKKAEDMLFAPRFKLGEDRQDRQCLSDNDIGDDDITDLEPDSVMSDVEGLASPRLIPVRKTDRTVSMNSINSPRSDADTDWEITDCELDDEVKVQDGPKILPGAKGAQQLRGSSAKSRELPSADARRRGGVQNDSRRRYIALNSLRRKANKLALQADIRKQARPDSSSGSRPLVLAEV